jgi:hypothetical protein
MNLHGSCMHTVKHALQTAILMLGLHAAVQYIVYDDFPKIVEKVNATLSAGLSSGGGQHCGVAQARPAAFGAAAQGASQHGYRNSARSCCLPSVSRWTVLPPYVRRMRMPCSMLPVLRLTMLPPYVQVRASSAHACIVGTAKLFSFSRLIEVSFDDNTVKLKTVSLNLHDDKYDVADPPTAEALLHCWLDPDVVDVATHLHILHLRQPDQYEELCLGMTWTGTW